MTDPLFQLQWQSDESLATASTESEEERETLSSSDSLLAPAITPMLSQTPPSRSHEVQRHTTPATSFHAEKPSKTPNPSQKAIDLVPRGYQLELFNRACNENIIAYLETGAGKTLVSALLIKKTIEDLEAAAARSNVSSENEQHHPPQQLSDNALAESAVGLNGGNSTHNNPLTQSKQQDRNLVFKQNASPPPGEESIVPNAEDKRTRVSTAQRAHQTAPFDDATRLQSCGEPIGETEMAEIRISRLNLAPKTSEKEPENGEQEPENGEQVPNDESATSKHFANSSLDNAEASQVKNQPGSIEKTICVPSKSARPTSEENKIAVFLVHRVPLVPQQAQVIQSVMHSHVQVGSYFGERGVDDWSSSKWARSLETKKVLVMTAQIFLNLLRHGLIDIRNVALMVLDEVHHATKNHPYRRLFLEFYHTLSVSEPKPRVFGMTATPVKAKAASQKSEPCLKAILALEVTLDATVVTVSSESRSEVEVLVPKPEEFVASFKGSEMTIPLDEERIGELETPSVTTVMDMVSGCEQKVGRELPKMEGKGNTKESTLEQAETDMLYYLLWKLGFRAAGYFAKQLCGVKGISADETVESLLKRSPRRDIETGGITEKVSVLLDILISEYKRCKDDGKASMDSDSSSEKFRCIVFVQERVTAVALAWLINAVFKDFMCPELYARSAVGVQNSASHVRMSQAKLLGELEDFRKGLYGILVATNVVEEGLDVPACRLVVACDTVVSPAAYVQGRGRARKRGARYIAFLEFGSEEQYSEVYRAREGAKIMSLVAGSEKPQEHERQEQRNELFKESLFSENKLYSKTTRARVTATEAVSLLHRYTIMKAAAGKQSDDSKPQYTFTRLITGAYTCRVTLHSRVPIDCGLCTSPQETELHAKRAAALDAYAKLYRIGEVDEFLLPKRPTRPERVLRVLNAPHMKSSHLQSRRRRRRTDREVQPKAAKKDRRLRECRIIHPNALRSISNEAKDVTVTGRAAALTSSTDIAASNTDSNSNQPLKPIMRTGGDEDADCQVQLQITTSPRASNGVECGEMLMYSINIDAGLHDLDFVRECDHVKFGILMKNEVPSEDWKAMRCPSGEDLLSLKFERSMRWSAEHQKLALRYVRSVQLCLRGRAPGSPGAIDIEQKDYSKNRNAGFLLVPLTTNTDNEYDVDWHSIEKLLHFGWRIGPLQKDECEQDLQQRYEDSLLCSYHESMDRVYLSGRLSERLQACSSSKGLLNPTFTSFADYFARKHHTPLRNKKQNLVEGFIVLDKMCRLSTSTFMLPPETCRVIPIPPIACYIASLLPKWQTFLALRSCWRRNRISTSPNTFLAFARALQPNVNNLAKNCADWSYERLEFLGDAVLKVLSSMAAFVTNPEDNEGYLSDARDFEVSNQKLADLAIEMKIHHCVAFSGISQKAKAWPWFWGTHQNESIQISQKVLADCVEALIGSQYLQGGIEAAATFMDRHKVLPGACEVLGIDENGGKREGVRVKVPDLPPGDVREESAFVREVEEIIGYRFQDKGHLVVALTHGSFRNGHCPSYQRYEYLGDAIIGFLLLSHFFQKYQNLSPGELTSLRGPALSNDLFARVVVSLKINERFWFDCPPLDAEIKRFADLVANEENDDEDVCKTMTVPKVLGDLLEAIIGAIVVDKGMKLDGVQDVVLKLMDVELDRFCNPEKFKHNPISELVHLAQKVHNVLPEYLYLDENPNTVKVCSIVLNNREVSRATGPTRRVAKHRAAAESLRILAAEQESGGRSAVIYSPNL